jgi:hypothetical protein
MAAHDSSPFAGAFAKDADREFVVRCVLGLAPSGGADLGEVLAAVADARTDGAWTAAWRGLGERVAASARTALAEGRAATGAWESLRAANYLAVAVDAASADGDDALGELFAAHRAAWDAFAAHGPFPATRVDVPLEEATMPGYLFRAAGDGPHPTIVFVNGSDGSISSLWGTGVAAALARGYDAYVFDGPGQQSMLFEQGVLFRPDWEHVLGPVVDALVALPGVDAARLAVWGISQGGFWVPRALSGEHRFSAAVVDPGVVDVSASWTAHLPGSMRKLLADGHDARFDSEMGMALRVSHELSRTWTFRARPFGGGSPAEVLRRVAAYALTAEQTAAITAPLLVTSPEGEQFWPGQSESLATQTDAVATLVRFTAAEGAQGHCEPLARTLVHERVLDWLARTLD